VDGYVQDGKSHVWAIIDKPDVSQGPYFADAMHITPTELDAGTVRKIEETVQAAVVAVGLDDSPVHVEARIDQGQCYIREIAARVAFVRVLRDARGIDPMQAMIALRFGNTLEAAPCRNRYAGGYCITPDKSGVFSHIANLEQVGQIPGISEISVYVAEGTRVAPAPESTGDVAHVRACADTYDDVLEALALAKRELRVVVR
jgi:biotin carboxylase